MKPRFSSLLAVLLLGILLSVSYGTQPTEASPSAGAPDRPVCPGGPQTDLTPPSGPPGVAPIRDCVTAPDVVIRGNSIARNVVGRDRRPGYPQLGYELIGAKTGQYWSGGVQTLGIWGSMQTSNPSLPKPYPAQTESDQQHVVNAFEVQSHRRQAISDTFMEVGWLKCNWSAACKDGPRVFVFIKDPASVKGLHYLFGNLYPLQAGQHYYFSMQYWQAPTTWITWLWWNGAWQELVRSPLGFSYAPATWENWEVFDGGTSPTFYVPASEFGWAAPVQIFDPGPWAWRNWDTSVGTHELGPCSINGKYCLTWWSQYYYWRGYTN